MKKKAFTLIELMIAMGLMAMVFAMASVIFKVTVESHRGAIANTEILQKLRVITEQLDADFTGLTYQYGGYLSSAVERFQFGDTIMDVNTDAIVMFAIGDFQSTDRYSDKTIVGNAAIIFYGFPDMDSFASMPDIQDNMLLRRQTIFTAAGPDSNSYPTGEYYHSSFSQWQVNVTDTNDLTSRPLINPDKPAKFLPMLLAKGVSDFKIEYNEGDIDSNGIVWLRKGQLDEPTISPVALKFTFRLHDSKGFIKEGRVFTHIVTLLR
jgi:prepilin-type N-terminal cleavage/methylation domain-containing protein